MKISVQAQGVMGANCYMIESENTALIIDPSAHTPMLKSFIEGAKGKEIFIIATHRHCDHVAAIAELKEEYSIPVAVSEADACGLQSTADSLGDYFGIRHKAVSPDILLTAGQTTLGDLPVTVIFTPGHTEGSICLLIDNILISGDTLFCLSIGRTDFPTGSMTAMQQSLARLFCLPDDCVVYPGHGEATTIGFEKQNNPYYFREF
ncbi:MAG: MBL fold metallo-hydrolase [Clostridia bacterium]|nr:MBL fold metallo-hydrolase [Clostridia bacterium]